MLDAALTGIADFIYIVVVKVGVTNNCNSYRYKSILKCVIMTLSIQIMLLYNVYLHHYLDTILT
ncbi:hypothetical protein GCM10007415_33750 [Parapedobacter pyrenivorans]|uniref:Uncharacterized protein n=1 Tax=Parapedobacter pyrenivorans TaxID=1305674 RepID=A0A917HX44_9SPHI|nr:hypothetical protein GCM10007415_33750 [Parapedobacter pyrenivorans]